MQNVNERIMFHDRRSPLIIEPASTDRDLAAIVATNAAAVESRLLEHGALLFRGFAVSQISDFERFVAALPLQRMDYIYRSTPRTALGNNIFTATEYPSRQHIPLHNENSYQREWPLKIALCCLSVATTGGETPIADLRAVTATIGGRLMDKFEARQVRYVRHYRPSVDVPWQKVFATEDRSEVAGFCARNDIAHEWLDAETLRTVQVCQGTARHPLSNERVFFNQAHLFHVSSLGSAGAANMINVFGADRLPRQTYYGDGTSIPPEDLTAVRDAFAGAAMSFPWRAGDVVLLDNMQFAHGRNPFEGNRKVVVALLEAHSPR